MSGASGLQVRAEAEETEPGGWRLLSPGVGWLRGLPAAGDRLAAGAGCGELLVLGRRHALWLPPDASGHWVAVRSEGPVAFGELLARLAPASAEAGPGAGTPGAAEDGAAAGLVVRAPTGGRFYSRKTPGEPPFVQPGDRLEAGRTLALIEVMKTFTRLVYGGPGLPDPARVEAILARDGEDVEEGQPLVSVAALEGM